MPSVIGWPDPLNPTPAAPEKKPKPFAPSPPFVPAPPVEPGAKPSPPEIPVEEPPVEPLPPEEPTPAPEPEPKPPTEPETPPVSVPDPTRLPPLTPRTEPPDFEVIPGEGTATPGEPGGELPKPRKPRRQPGTVPDFAVLAALIIAYGLAAMAAALSEFLNWLVFQWFPPSIARKIKPIPTQHITKAITSALGSYEQAFDADIGNNFHKFATVLNRLGAGLVAVAQLEVTLAHKITRTNTHLAKVHTAVHHLSGRVETQAKQIRHQGARVTTEHHRATTAERGLAKRIRRETHYRHHVIEPEVKRLTKQTKQLEKGHAADTHRLTRLEKMLGLAGITALVSTGLHRLGTDYIRCDANKELGRANCGVGRDFWRKILGDALDALIIADLCEIMAGMTFVAHEFAPVLKVFVDVEDALLHCPSADYPPALALEPLHVPAVHQPFTFVYH
jgi:hypothetical protein